MAISGPVDAGSVHYWYGLSTDTKPGAGQSVPGDVFTETDTAYVYYRTPLAWVLRDAGSVAVADQTLHAGEPGSGVPLDAVGYWEKAVIDATGATVVYTGPCIYGGYIIVAAAGAHTMTLYDNTAASGQVLLNALSVNSAADATKAMGIKCDNGITANLSGNPTDGLVLVLYKAL
jgi:hypothetical protein